MTPLLEARAIEAWHARKRVLASCSLRITRGEIFGVYGPNGAGKTTLLQALAQLHPNVRGELLFDGQVVARDLSLREYRRRSAVVFQDCLLVRGTVLDNVALGLKLRRIDALERERRARGWLDRLRILNLAARRAHGLSGGETQRVSLARAFVLEPDIIFLDEPFSALDAPTREALVDDLRSVLAEAGTTAVFVTHDPDELRDLCERCLILDQGSVLQIGPVSEVFDQPRSRRAAEIIGADNIITAAVTRVDDTSSYLDWDGETLRVPVITAAPGALLTFMIKPEDIEVRLPPVTPVTIPPGALAGTVVRTRRRGRDLLVTVRLRNGRTLRAVTPATEHVVGANAFLIPQARGFRFIESAHMTTIPTGHLGTRSVGVRGE